MKLYTLIAFVFLLSSGTHRTKIPPVRASVNYDQLKEIIEKNDDKLYVVNFWATWCRPCIEELPHFLEVSSAYENQAPFQMILVSLDKAELLETDVAQMITKLNIDNDVYLLDDNKRMNYWISAVDSTWSGAIPATVFYKNGQKLHFTEGQLTKEELTTIIQKHL
jgi:thiol-disulfide isomerase/thioredoxin